ncbi:DUF1631 family protein [Hydrogenophaga sp. A37]|uniref:DUF1631 family protein n=1 Tax=Hydrogenophaga sp. A37 TaxID=1945864 RepID=UPI000986AE7A|nr:DUF1631 family protein [Hydrogenophaga sp. A37]
MNAPKMLRLGMANDASKLRPTLQDCLEAALSISDSMIDELLEGLNAALDPDRPGAAPSSDDPLQLELVEQLTEEADALKRTWHEQLRKVLYHGSVLDATGPAAVRFDDLRQLDDRSIDATIGFAVAEQAIRSASAEQLPRLNALVSSLMGWMTVQPELNPLRPAAFAHALRELLVRHVPDDAQRGALLSPAAGMLGESLRQVYRELIQWLLVHGVEPVVGPTPMAQREQGPQGAVGRTMLTLGRLRQLLAGDLSNEESGGQTFVHTVPLSLTALEDMDLIEPLIQRLRLRASSTEEPPVKPELPIILENNLGRLLGQEVVRLMLDNLTQDERLLPAIRQQIGLLEPILIKLSQADPRFFSERRHPARQLLEEITQRSLGYQGQNDPGFSKLLESIIDAVYSLNRAAATEEVFARLLKRLRRRWEQDDAIKNQMRAEAARALMHAEQRHLLAERLAADFQRQTQDKDVPEFVLQFLCGPWSQVVAESQLAGVVPVETDEPIDRVAEDLIWSVQTDLIRRDTDRLVKLVPRLLGQLRQGLQRIEYPPDLTARLFDMLVAVHEQAFDRPAAQETGDEPLGAEIPTLIERVDDPALAVVPAPAEHGETFWMAHSEAADAGYVSEEPVPIAPDAVDAQGADLATGAWVDLLIQGTWVRAELTWTSPHGSLFMFISAKGLAHSMTRRTLDRLRNADQLRVVSRGGMVEGALDAVAQLALRNQSEADGDAEPGTTP